MRRWWKLVLLVIGEVLVIVLFAAALALDRRLYWVYFERVFLVLNVVMLLSAVLVIFLSALIYSRSDGSASQKRWLLMSVLLSAAAPVYLAALHSTPTLVQQDTLEWAGHVYHLDRSRDPVCVNAPQYTRECHYAGRLYQCDSSGNFCVVVIQNYNMGFRSTLRVVDGVVQAVYDGRFVEFTYTP